MKNVLCLCALTLLIAACQLEGIDNLPPGSTPSPTLGKVLFQQNRCIGCHNADASGHLAAEAADLRGTTLSYLAVLKQVRAPKGQMPARTKDDVSDEEVASIYAWLKTLAPQTLTPDPNTTTIFPTPMPEPTKIVQVAPPTLAPTRAPTDTPAPTAKPGEPTSTPAPTKTPTAIPPTSAPAPKVDIARLIAAQEHADELKTAADYAKDATNNVAELRNYAGQGLTAAQALQTELNGLKAAYSDNVAFKDLQAHLDAYVKFAQFAAQTNDFAAGKAQAGQMTIEGRI
ncbi:MAG: c-type cytochrome, partial [Chloroflexota bacterium]